MIRRLDTADSLGAGLHSLGQDALDERREHLRYV